MARRRKPPPNADAGELPDPLGMRALLPEHLEWMRSRDYSETTVESREMYVGYFLAWCEERGVTRPSEVTLPVLERYRRMLYHHRKKNGHPLSFSSKHNRLVAVRVFFKWLSRQKHVLYNPASELELPRAEKRLPRNVMSAAEAEQVLNHPDVNTPTGVRDRAILETLYSTGMRRTELIGLGVDDLDLERGTLMVRLGKWKKDRMLPVGERALSWIGRYLEEVRPEFLVEPDDGTLFLTRDGGAFEKNHLTLLVSRHVNASGVGKKGSCHMFRHTMATLMLEGGADIRYIQQMLGHEDLRTTQIYTQVSIRKLKEVHTATHPSARLERTARAQEELEDEEEDERQEEFLAELAAEEEDV